MQPLLSDHGGSCQKALKIASPAVALVLRPSLELAAQERALLAPGARVRVAAPVVGANRVLGTVAAVDGDTLF